MAVSRYGDTATLLADGKVLIAGGFGNSGVQSQRRGLHAPPRGHSRRPVAWRSCGLATRPRCSATARSSSPGDSPTTCAQTGADIYDPTTGTFSTTGGMAVGRYNHTASLPANGKVLVAGGSSSKGTEASAELFGPKSHLGHTGRSAVRDAARRRAVERDSQYARHVHVSPARRHAAGPRGCADAVGHLHADRHGVRAGQCVGRDQRGQGHPVDHVADARAHHLRHASQQYLTRCDREHGRRVRVRATGRHDARRRDENTLGHVHASRHGPLQQRDHERRAERPESHACRVRDRRDVPVRRAVTRSEWLRQGGQRRGSWTVDVHLQRKPDAASQPGPLLRCRVLRRIAQLRGPPDSDHDQHHRYVVADGHDRFAREHGLRRRTGRRCDVYVRRYRIGHRQLRGISRERSAGRHVARWFLQLYRHSHRPGRQCRSTIGRVCAEQVSAPFRRPGSLDGGLAIRTGRTSRAATTARSRTVRRLRPESSTAHSASTGRPECLRVGDVPALTMADAVSYGAWIFPTGAGVGEAGTILSERRAIPIARFPDGTIRLALANASQATRG